MARLRRFLAPAFVALASPGACMDSTDDTANALVAGEPGKDAKVPDAEEKERVVANFVANLEEDHINNSAKLPPNYNPTNVFNESNTEYVILKEPDIKHALDPVMAKEITAERNSSYRIETKGVSKTRRFFKIWLAAFAIANHFVLPELGARGPLRPHEQGPPTTGDFETFDFDLGEIMQHQPLSAEPPSQRTGELDNLHPDQHEIAQHQLVSAEPPQKPTEEEFQHVQLGKVFAMKGGSMDWSDDEKVFTGLFYNGDGTEQLKFDKPEHLSSRKLAAASIAAGLDIKFGSEYQEGSEYFAKILWTNMDLDAEGFGGPVKETRLPPSFVVDVNTEVMLSNWIQARRANDDLQWADVGSIIKQLLMALDYLRRHPAQWVVLNLSKFNIAVKDTGNKPDIRIFDYSTATALSTVPDQTAFSCVSAYCPVDFRAEETPLIEFWDMHAVALILFEMLIPPTPTCEVWSKGTSCLFVGDEDRPLQAALSRSDVHGFQAVKDDLEKVLSEIYSGLSNVQDLPDSLKNLNEAIGNHN